MNRLEALALSIAKMNGAFDDPTSDAFRTCNPGRMRTYRPEKKCDSDHYRIFTTMMGGFKALIAELQARMSGQNHRLSAENSLRDLLSMYGFAHDAAVRKIVLFVQKSLQDDSVTANTKLSFFIEAGKE